MKKVTYLGVFEPNGSGAYGIYFPDFPGCGSIGDTLEEAMNNAEEVLSLHYYGMSEDGDDIPEPSDITAFSPEDVNGNIIMPVTIYPERFKKEMESRRVKTNCTIPLWLKKAAEEAGVNFSKLLEKALIEELQL